MKCDARIWIDVHGIHGETTQDVMDYILELLPEQGEAVSYTVDVFPADGEPLYCAGRKVPDSDPPDCDVW